MKSDLLNYTGRLKLLFDFSSLDRGRTDNVFPFLPHKNDTYEISMNRYK